MFYLSSCLDYFPVLLAIVFSFLGAHATVPSPRASSDLICRTSNAADCYPSIFQPTEEFQVIKDDQSLPPGLHVRLNLATGVKEARLNVPEPEDAHSDLVIVEKPEPEEPIPESQLVDKSEDIHVPLHHDQSILDDTPRIRTPPFGLGEASTFEESMSQLRNLPSSNPNYDPTPALTALQDLCHSADWGLKLTKDSNVTRLLVHSFRDVSQKLAVRSGAALLLATAIQNNPDALAAAISHFYNDEWPTGPLDAVLLAFMHEQSTSLLIRTVFLLSSLCQDQNQLVKFVNMGGLRILIEVFPDGDISQPDHDKLRGKIANFILDHIAGLDQAALRAEAAKHSHSLDVSTNAPTTADDDDWVVVPDKPTTAVDLRWEVGQWELALRKASEDLSNKDSNEAKTALASVVDAHKALREQIKRI